MVFINRIKITKKNEISRFSSCIEIGSSKITIWFDITSKYSHYVVDDRCDAFVGCLLFSAISYGHDIDSCLPISSDLYFQFNEHLIPQLANILKKKPIRLNMPVSYAPINSKGMVGTGFSRGVDSFYTIAQHITSTRNIRPNLTHLVIMNNGVFEGEEAESIALNLFDDAKILSKRLQLDAIYIASNIQDVLNENFLEVVAYRNMSCALLLQKLFSTYLYSSGHGLEDFEFHRKSTGEHELFVTYCFSTKALRFINAGAGVTRIEKLKALSNFEPCYDMLHPCFVSWHKNCGHCRKCRRDTVTLIALGSLEKFHNVFDVDFAKKNFDINVAFLLATKHMPLYGEVLKLLKERDIPISRRSKLLAQQFTKGMENLQNDSIE